MFLRAQVFSIPDGGDACLLLAQLGYVAQPAATATASSASSASASTSASSASAAAAAADPALRCVAIPRDQYSRNAAHKHDIDHAVAELGACRAELGAWLREASRANAKGGEKQEEHEARAAACVKQLCAALNTVDAVRAPAIHWRQQLEKPLIIVFVPFFRMCCV